MKTFRFSRVTCNGCGTRKASKFRRSCAACRKESFTVEIERSASGIDLPALFAGSRVAVGALIDEATDDHGSPYFRTHSVLRCTGVFGSEIAAFMRAPIDERKRMYVGWKRREIEATLDADHAICDRCGIAFKRYENPWNRAGLCSRSCHHAYVKSQSQ